MFKKLYFIFAFICLFCLGGKVSALDDGVYEIESLSAANQVIGIKNDNVIVDKKSNSDSQKWIVTKLEEEYYYISSFTNENKRMDVANDSKVNGGNVLIWGKHNGDNQKWLIKDIGNGIFEIQSKSSELFLNVDKQNVNIWEDKNTNNQKFKFNKLTQYQKTIDDGLYEISSALNNNKTINISGEVINGSNIDIWSGGSLKQKWNVKYLNNGFYVISSYIDSSKVLDVYRGLSKNGTNVDLWTGDGSSSNQQWLIKDAGNGYYNIISRCNGLSIDISNASTADGANVLLWNSHDGDNQKFKFTKVEAGSKTIDDGLYEISSALNSNKTINISGEVINGSNIDIWSGGSLKQKWNVKYLNNGFYVISSYVDSSKVLDVYRGLTKNGTNVDLWTGDGSSSNQQWLIKDAGNGYYNIISRCNGLSIDISNASSADGANVLLWNSHDGANQKFKFTKVEAGSKTIDDGLYEISTPLADSKVLTLSNGKTINGTSIIINDNINNNSQKWYINYLNNGFYSITSYAEPSKGFDVKGALMTKGNNLQLWSDSKSNNQQWFIRDAGNGYFNIISRCNGLNLDISGGVANNGAVVGLWTSHNGDNQKFRLTKIYEGAQTIDDGLYTINSTLNNNMVVGLDLEMAFNGDKIQLETFANLDSQKWYVNYIGNGYYSLISALSGGKGLDIPKNSYNENVVPELFSKHNGANQQWIIKDNGNGSFSIISSYNSLFLDVKDSVDNGVIRLMKESNKNNQKFVFNETTLSGAARIIDDGYYKMQSALNLSKAVDVHGGLKLNSTNVEIYNLHSGNNQIWYFKYLNNGFYSITSAMNPRLSLDVHGGGMQPGTNVEIFKNYVSDNQQWSVRDVGNGYYSIVSKINGLNLEAVADNNGSNMHVNKSNNSNNQKFKLVRHQDKKKYTGIDISQHQGSIDWNKISKTDLGFVIIRAGFGGDWTNQDDERFIENVAGCERYNIPYGLYLYSYAKGAGNGETDGAAEAKHIMRLLNKISTDPYYYKPNIKTKVFIDIEDPSVVGKVPNSNLTSLADQFCNILEKSGYECGIYSYANLLKDIVNNSIASKYDIWVAEWGGNYNRSFAWALNNSPAYNHYYKYWQFSSKGTYTGINGYVDYDIGYDIFD